MRRFRKLSLFCDTLTDFTKLYVTEDDIEFLYELIRKSQTVFIVTQLLLFPHTSVKPNLKVRRNREIEN